MVTSRRRYVRRVSVLCLLMVCLTALPLRAGQSATAPAGVEAEGKADLSDRYAINLLSSLDPIDPASLPRLDVFARYRLYITRVKKNGKVWYRLRLGFFPSRKAAEEVAESLRGTFEEAWVTVVSRQERERSGQSAVDFTAPQELRKPVESKPTTTAQKRPDKVRQSGPRPPTSSFGAAAPAPAGEGAAGPPPVAEQKTAAGETAGPLEVSEARLQSLMDEAEKAMTQGDYRRAIQHYTKVLQYPDHKFLSLAQELLGLARERNGQLAQARAEYENYLHLYPKGEAADRVRQRLAGLVTARAEPKEKLPKATRATTARTAMYGSFAQFYNRYESFTDPGGNTVTQSLLASNLDLNVNRRSDDYDLTYVLSMGYDQDFLDNADSNANLSRNYIDVLYRPKGLSARLGRQTRGTDGVLGRFDGGVLSYRIVDRVKLNVLSGMALKSSVLEGYDSNKFFYGASVDLGTLASHWDFNLYTIRQEDDGIVDRHAIGAEARYFDPKRSFFSTLDYDVSYNELNTVLFIGNWTFPDKTTVNIVADYRKSPLLTTNNALIGQSVGSLSALSKTLSESQIWDLARDRTADSWSLNLGITRPLHEKLQLGGEFRISELKGTKASGGVAEVPGTGIEYFYTAQVIGNSLIKQGDIAIIGLGYSDTNNADVFSLNVNTRYPLTREWRVNPRMLVSYSLGKGSNVDHLRLRPSLATEYYWRRRVRFELNGGAEWSRDWVPGQTAEAFDYFVTLGYRLDF